MNHQSIMFVAIAMAFFAGCVPGEAGFLIKTSALNKVMRGEQAEIMVRVKDSRVISNANDKVSIDLKGIETERDFVCALTNLYSEMFVAKMFVDDESSSGKWSNRNMSFVLEERKNDWPILKMEATFPAFLTRKSVRPDTQKGGVGCVPTLFCFDYDPENGYLDYSKSIAGIAYSEYRGRVEGANRMLATLNSINSNENVESVLDDFLFIRDPVVAMASLPLYVFLLKNKSFFVKGDDDKPIFVIGKNVKVNGKPVADYQAWIRKGDEVCITVEAEKSNSLDGNSDLLERVRFFESEAQAKAVKDAEDKNMQPANNNAK